MPSGPELSFKSWNIKNFTEELLPNDKVSEGRRQEGRGERGEQRGRPPREVKRKSEGEAAAGECARERENGIETGEKKREEDTVREKE